jgi:hypothetical protein
LVTFVLSRTVEKVDSIRFAVFKRTRCLAGKSKKHNSGPRSSRSFSAAFGHLTQNSLSKALAASRACSRSSASLTDATEVHPYEQLYNLTNLDLHLVCYDITSSYFETVADVLQAMREAGQRIPARSRSSPLTTRPGHT